MTTTYEVLGVRINAAPMREAVQLVVDRALSDKGGYVCFCNVHTTVMGAQTQSYNNVLNGSFLSLPDGKPIFWVGKVRNVRNLERVCGPDFMLKMLETQTENSLRHYFIGGTPDVLEALVQRVKKDFKHARIVGWESPPFRPLTNAEIKNTIARINECKPDMVWVGLGAPKQEVWMNSFANELSPAVLLGVGAAFDFHAHTKKRAPEWMRAYGMEWFYRLLQEPRRLFSRYLITNSLFLWLLLKEKME